MRDTDKNRKMPGGKKIGSLSAVKLSRAVKASNEIHSDWSEDNLSWEWCDGDYSQVCGDTPGRCKHDHYPRRGTTWWPGTGQLTSYHPVYTMFTGTMPILSLVTPLTLHLVSDGTYLNVFLHSKHYPWVIRLKAWCKMQIDPRFPPRLSLSDTFWLQVANIFRFPKIFISLIRPSIWMMLILIVFSPITALCAECLVGTIISRAIESHLPCFDKSTSCDTRQMAPSLHLSLVMVDITGPSTHGYRSKSTGVCIDDAKHLFSNNSKQIF